jgi:hypothetical protein
VRAARISRARGAARTGSRASFATSSVPWIGATELARARTLLELSRAELTAEQLSLLSRRLAAAERLCEARRDAGWPERREPGLVYLELEKCYLSGRGVRQSKEKATKYLELAARSEPEARHLLQRLSAIERVAR